MDPAALKIKLKQIAQHNHADLMGITNVNNWHGKPEHSPHDFLQDAKSVIIIGSPLPRTAHMKMPFRNPIKMESINNQALNFAGYALTKELEEDGFQAIFIPGADYADQPEVLEKDSTYKEIMIGDISLPYAGVRAGLGVIGKSGILLHPKYGPFISLAAIITDAQLPINQPLDADYCGDCTRCIKACYTGALEPNGNYDPLKCQNDPKGKVYPAWLNYSVCPAACRISCPIGLSQELNPGASLHNEDPFQHAPYDLLHKLPKK